MTGPTNELPWSNGPPSRIATILELIAEQDATDPGPAKLCRVAMTFTKLDGAAVGLHRLDESFIILCASTPVARHAMDLEATLGEGPCSDAARGDFLVSETHFDSLARARWPLYVPAARELGVEAVLGIPIRIGAVRLGALLLYRTRSGELTATQSADCHLMASVIARAILAIQAGAPRDTLAHELDLAATFDLIVQQAAGMVAVQGAMPIKDALVLVRAHGFAMGVPSPEVAARIVARELRYDPVETEWLDAGGLSESPGQ